MIDVWNRSEDSGNLLEEVSKIETSYFASWFQALSAEVKIR
ncbi:MAG: hypothetical protein ABEJ95_07100 [Candidatus Nanohalobium sp.]